MKTFNFRIVLEPDGEGMAIGYSHLRSRTAREFISALAPDGFVLDRQAGAHRLYLHPDVRARAKGEWPRIRGQTPFSASENGCLSPNFRLPRPAVCPRIFALWLSVPEFSPIARSGPSPDR
jgi:hypothetical protein